MILTHPEQLDALPVESTILSGVARLTKTPEGWQPGWFQLKAAYTMTSEEVALLYGIHLLNAEAKTVEDLDGLLDGAVVFLTRSGEGYSYHKVSRSTGSWYEAGEDRPVTPDDMRYLLRLGGPIQILHPGCPT